MAENRTLVFVISPTQMKKIKLLFTMSSQHKIKYHCAHTVPHHISRTTLDLQSCKSHQEVDYQQVLLLL